MKTKALTTIARAFRSETRNTTLTTQTMDRSRKTATFITARKSIPKNTPNKMPRLAFLDARPHHIHKGTRGEYGG